MFSRLSAYVRLPIEAMQQAIMDDVNAAQVSSPSKPLYITGNAVSHHSVARPLVMVQSKLQRKEPVEYAVKMRRADWVLLLVMMHATVSRQRAPISDREVGRQWLDRMKGPEALAAGKAWLARATASRDFREATWAEMLIKKSVADASAEQDTGTLGAALFHLGRTLKLLGKLRESLEAFSKCAALRPDRAVFAQLGAVAEEAQEWETATEAFSRMADAAEAADDVMALRSASSARASLGWVFFRAGRTEEALEAFRKASWLSPDDPQVYYRLARGMELHGGQESSLYANTGKSICPCIFKHASVANASFLLLGIDAVLGIYAIRDQ